MNKSILSDNIKSILCTLKPNHSENYSCKSEAIDAFTATFSIQKPGLIKAISGIADGRYYENLAKKIQARFEKIDIRTKPLSKSDLKKIKWLDFEKMTRSERHRFNTQQIFKHRYKSNVEHMAEDLGCSIELANEILDSEDPKQKVMRLFKERLALESLTLPLAERHLKKATVNFSINNQMSELEIAAQLSKLDTKDMEILVEKIQRASTIIASDSDKREYYEN
ncbi:MULTISPECIES: hypothetical protein [Vibrio]|nr:hypothetical protein [Vibrio tasmaniensis]TKG28991.1 hypothetical protein FC057_20105 [Vibrio tasmaniensis]TKG41610.1 hypothetical protein FC063_07045 [Vibrio tasmaniensis]TKG46259.1 hypothetical protein FC070_22510 [Vibrio tasmaniensis]TKG50668.1 hypothetical protein FC060_06120 [Vibrio tasmaniensis]TKG56286.1 hypothetical protein FC061_02855 [Vibrio tasmaniensis]